MLKNEKGFTLVEMLIVMLVVSILLIVTIPQVAKTNEKIQNKGCEAYIQMVQSQVQLYELENNKKVNGFDDLKGDYLKDGENNKCPNGELLDIQNSVVVRVSPASEEPEDDPNANE